MSKIKYSAHNMHKTVDSEILMISKAEVHQL